MVKYKVLDDMATADVCFDAYGKTLEELFESAAVALFETMTDIKKVGPKIKREISIKSTGVDTLLFDWLDELIFLKDSESLLLSRFKIKIHKNKEYMLEATVIGENIVVGRHEQRIDVKAVTYHMFNVKHDKGLWTARIVLDI